MGEKSSASPSHSDNSTADRSRPYEPFLRPFGDQIPEWVQRLNLVIIGLFVLSGTVVAFVWIGGKTGPPPDLFVSLIGMNSALVIALAVEAQTAEGRFERWIVTGVTGAVAGTLLSALLGLAMPDTEIGRGISSLSVIPAFGGSGLALGTVVMFLFARIVREADAQIPDSDDARATAVPPD